MEVGGLVSNEVTDKIGPQGVTRSMPQRKESGHGSHWHRSGWKGISDLRTRERRGDDRGKTLVDRSARQVPREAAQERGDRGDVRGGLRGCGYSQGAGSRGTGGTGEPGASARGGRTPQEERPKGCAEVERDVVPDGSAFGPRSIAAGARSEDDLRDARIAGRGAHQAGQHRAWLAPEPSSATAIGSCRN